MSATKDCPSCGTIHFYYKSICDYCGYNFLSGVWPEHKKRLEYKERYELQQQREMVLGTIDNNFHNGPEMTPAEGVKWANVFKIAKVISVIVVIACFITLPNVLKSDWFLIKYFPEKYWNKKQKYWQDKVSDLEGSVAFDLELIADTRLEIKKLKATSKYAVAQEANLARSVGESVIQAKKEAKEMIKQNLDDLKEELLSWEEDLINDKNELENAKSNLSIVIDQRHYIQTNKESNAEKAMVLSNPN